MASITVRGFLYEGSVTYCHSVGPEWSLFRLTPGRGCYLATLPILNFLLRLLVRSWTQLEQSSFSFRDESVAHQLLEIRPL